MNSDLLEKARELGEDNREAIEAYNELVRKNGVFSTGLRTF